MSPLLYILAESAESSGVLEQVMRVVTGRGPYLLFLFLVLFGFYLMMTHKNALKGMVGLTIFQTGIIVFFIFLAFIGGNKYTVAILTTKQTKAYKQDKKDHKAHKDEKKYKDAEGHDHEHEDHAHHEDHHDEPKTLKPGETRIHAEVRKFDHGSHPEPNPNYRDMEKKYPKQAAAIQAMPPQNPLPHALMLTAIVVGVATMGVAIAIMMRMNKETGSIEDDGLEGEDD